MEFVAEVHRVANLLVEHQALGPKLDSRHRRLPLRRFPYALIYRVDSDAVRIVAVAHRRRRPNYWRPRTP
jgi:plasmid stabilization system protein ParE